MLRHACEAGRCFDREKVLAGLGRADYSGRRSRRGTGLEISYRPGIGFGKFRCIWIWFRLARQRAETGFGAAIHLPHLFFGKGRPFLDCDLYCSLNRFLIFYLFEGLSGVVEEGARGKIAELGVGHDLLDRSGGGFSRAGLGQVAHGDLEAVEEEAGTLVVDVAAGEPLQDLGEGALDGAAVFERRQLKEIRLVAIDAQGFGGDAAGVVVIAKLFPAQAGAAAAVAVGEDVAAAVAPGRVLDWLGDVILHGGTPLYLSTKVFKRKGLPLEFEADPVKCESPAVCRADCLLSLIIAHGA